jgi:hypothetical protein
MLRHVLPAAITELQEVKYGQEVCYNLLNVFLSRMSSFLVIKVERIRKYYVGYISMDSVLCAEFSLNNAHCMHVGQTYIMFCVSIETRLWKAELKKTVDKGCCNILNNRYPRCEWSSLAFFLHVLLCSTRVISGLVGFISQQTILFSVFKM